ncbi:MAG: uroporphyrinogen decarboxylase family protein [Candidatus Sulfotelmatobacter sp.]
MESATPRALIRAMVQGVRPPRPLLLPIVFSLGARLENVPLRAFLSNPTKIAGALRQLRGALALDGVVCYFDPYLEVEALGGEVQWYADGASRTLRAGSTDLDTLRERVPSPGEIGQLGRIPVACEVVRRLKVMLPGEPALAVSVSGPRALAAQLTGEAPGESVFEEATEFAAEVALALCKSFLDAGASVIFLREDAGAIRDPQCWADLLNPIVNVIRFYEALPVLLPASASAGDVPIAASEACEGLICPRTIDLSAAALSPQSAALNSAYLPIQELLSSEASEAALITFLQTLPPDLGYGLLTTQNDIAAETDIKRLASLLKTLQGGSRAVA